MIVYTGYEQLERRWLSDGVIFKSYSPSMWRGAMLCRYAVRVSIRCTNHHTCPCMAFVCYDTRTHTRGASWATCTCRPGYIAIVVAIKYIVLEGVSYNGFLLFIKTEGPLQSAAVCFLTTRVYLELCRSILSAILLINRMYAIRRI